MTALPYRRGRIVGLLALLLVMAFPIAFNDEARAATDLAIGGQAVVADAQGDNVNLRDQPSSAGNVLTSIPEGSFVTVVDGPFTDETDGSTWYQIDSNGQTGYALADYLSNPASGVVTPAATMTTTTRVNLRSGPGTSYAVLLVIPSGATVTPTGLMQNGFTQITYSGSTGWSSSQYLTITADAGSATTTASVNLRSGAGTTFSVILVIPNGSTVQITGALQNGFYPVTYNGTAGFASASYLTLNQQQTATVFDGALNLRSGPGTTYSVILLMPNGATVTITGALQNGFYPVSYSGTAGFASADFLRLDSQPIATPAWTTANLNLRSSASSSGTVLLVIPYGSAITITGTLTAGFYPVTYNGTSGFASASYITLTNPNVNRPAWTTTNLRLRSAADPNAGIVLVMPNGSPVTVTGNATNGFYPVTYNGTSGFASTTYITFAPPGGGGAIVWPVTGGGTWEVLQGYNGSSHQNESALWQYLYSLDIHRASGETAGWQVFAPVSGTVRWYERATGGITIDMGNGYAFAMFHLTVDRAWEPGDTINQGDLIGTVSFPGGEGFQEVPHIHLTLWQTNDGGNWDRHATPFTGQFAISGNDLPADGSTYQWSGFEFTP